MERFEDVFVNAFVSFISLLIIGPVVQQDTKSLFVTTAATGLCWTTPVRPGQTVTNHYSSPAHSASGVNQRFGKLRFVWKLDPTKGSTYDGSVYVPDLPQTLSQQCSWRLISGANPQVIEQSGNKILMFPSNLGAEEIEFTVEVKPVDLREKIKELEETATAEGDATSQKEWLKPTVPVDSDAREFQSLANELRKKNPVKTVRAVLAWMDKNYKKEVVFPLLPASRSLKRGSGECAANSMVFVGLCQAAGVPARVVQGLVNGASTLGESGTISCHMWAEVWFSGLDWVPVEPQRPNSLGYLAANDWLQPYIKLEHWDPKLSPYIPTNGATLTPASNLGLMTGSPGVSYHLLSRTTEK